MVIHSVHHHSIMVDFQIVGFISMQAQIHQFQATDICQIGPEAKGRQFLSLCKERFSQENIETWHAWQQDTSVQGPTPEYWLSEVIHCRVMPSIKKCLPEPGCTGERKAAEENLKENGNQCSSHGSWIVKLVSYDDLAQSGKHGVNQSQVRFTLSTKKNVE